MRQSPLQRLSRSLLNRPCSIERDPLPPLLGGFIAFQTMADMLSRVLRLADSARSSPATGNAYFEIGTVRMRRRKESASRKRKIFPTYFDLLLKFSYIARTKVKNMPMMKPRTVAPITI